MSLGGGAAGGKCGGVSGLKTEVRLAFGLFSATRYLRRSLRLQCTRVETFCPIGDMFLGMHDKLGDHGNIACRAWEGDGL